MTERNKGCEPGYQVVGSAQAHNHPMRETRKVHDMDGGCVIYIGVDIAKASFVAARHQAGQSELIGQFANQLEGYAALDECLAGVEGSLHLILEPTAAYHTGLVAYAFAQGWQVTLPNPKRVADWAKGTGRRAKTDQVDARLLADYGAACTPTGQQPLPPAVQQLEQLLRRQEDLAEMAGQERNRQTEQTSLADPVHQSLERMRQALAQEQAALQQAIDELLQTHPELRQQRQQLLQVPGIGPQNVLPILVWLYRWVAHTAGQGTAKGLTAYVGLDPVRHVSGATIHRPSAISKMGNTQIRSRLFLSALGGTRAKQSPLTTFYRRLLSRHKPKMVALVACARKILVWAWAVFRSGEPFDPKKALPKSDPLLT
jgi:transposase